MAINKKTEAIPGSAVINPSTTRRNRGAVEITRNTRNIRNARKTVNDPPVGTSDTATTNVSKMFHQFVKTENDRQQVLRQAQQQKSKDISYPTLG